jgi:cytosine/adenosine deaminase-related metal-dependent hydrolase
MCKLCDEGNPQNHSSSRRDFLKATAATGAAAAAADLFSPRPAPAHESDAPEDSGRNGRRYVIRGGSVMSMDPSVGDFPQADVLIEGKKIVAVGPNLHAGGATEIDARGRIVMPGFIDTHHHQFETALRSFLADGILINDQSGTPSGNITYYEYILLTFAPVYRPQDVYINELFGGLSQLDDGVTTVHDISQIHHSPAHSDAAIQGLKDAGRRAAFGYFEGAGFTHGPNYAYPQDAVRIKKQWFSSSDQLVSMVDATRINVAPLNQVPGAVVSLMDRTNVETVIVAGKIRKWQGQLLDVDLRHLRRQLEASRDYIFAAAGIQQDLFRSN